MSVLQDMRDRLGQGGLRGQGWLAWWRRALLAWVPARWRGQLAPARLLLWRGQDSLYLARQHDEQVDAPQCLPWPVAPPARQAGAAAVLPWYLVLAHEQVLRRTLRLPAAAVPRLGDVVRFEIDRQTPFAPTQVEYAARVLRPLAGGQVEIELVVVPRRGLERALAALDGWADTLSGVDAADAQGHPLGVNLLPPAQRHRRRDPTRRWQWGLWALALVLLVLAGARLLDNRHQAAAALRAALAAQAPRARQVAAERQQLADLVDGAAFLDRQRAARPPAIAVWDELTRRLPDDTVLEKFALEGGQLQLIGTSAQASALVGRLEGSPLWHKPALTGVLQGDGAGRDRFTLVAQLGPGDRPGEAADGDARP